MKRIGSVLLGLALAAGITLVTAEPAAAAFSDCPFGTGCVWSGPGGTGTRFIISFSSTGGAFHCIPNLGMSVQSATATYGHPITALEIFNGTQCDPRFGKVIKVNDPKTFPPFNMGSYMLLA